MRIKKTNKILSLILCIVLIVAMALFTTGCNDKKRVETPTQAETTVEVQVLGEGKTQFDFVVVDENGVETKFEIHTDKNTVGEALVDVDLIQGDEGEYGLMVTTVNGVTKDYNKDGAYWAFYVNDEYAMSGVDTTEIVEGDVYAFKVEKA